MNIDHVATLRQARWRSGPGGSTPSAPGQRGAAIGGTGGGASGGGEPDPVRAAHEAELGGAHIITVHLREDRRHLQDHDLERLTGVVRTRLNLEMAVTDEMVRLALVLRGRTGMPHMATLVPEGRHEVTTEGGLDVTGEGADRIRSAVKRLADGGLTVSAFIDADEAQIDGAVRAGFHCCEIHTGPYARAFALAGGDWRDAALGGQLERVATAGRRIQSANMRFHAGHALNYFNVGAIADLDGAAELHIGHAIVSRAIYTGMRSAVEQMISAMGRGR
ncbi:MAG: pyridoxine 5'-phosphate synthase [Phycisphaerales bacterium]|nr:pyridoxine 5'-phosphate synthase [Phycisphaerales bacterium]